MPEIIRNRAFNVPLSPNGSIPAYWTRAQNTPSWGGATWASGVYRAVGGGSMPSRGSRCLLVGAADATTETTSAELNSGDYCKFSQAIAGAACSSVSHIEATYLVADQGGDPSHSRALLSITDGTTTVTDADALSTATEHTEYTLRCATGTLDASKTWTVTIGVDRDATSALGGNVEVPRVYFDDVRCRWSAYTATPMRVLSYTDNICADATITGSTADTGFSVSNVSNLRASHPYVSTSATSAYIELDFGSAQTISLCALIDCNFQAGDTWTLAGGTTTNPSSISHTFACNDNKNAFVEFSPASYRYWRVSCSRSSAKQWRIGEIAIGLARHMQTQFSWGPSPSVAYSTKKHTTPYGSEFAYEKGYRRAYSLSYPAMDAADVAEMRAISYSSAGDVYPLLIVPKPDEYACYFGTLQGSWSEVERYINVGVPGTIDFSEQAHALVQS